MDNAGLFFVTNQAAPTRIESQGGRDFLVVPVVAVREGVLNGELVTAQEIEKHPLSWNGRPFVIGHPPSNNGIAGSANDAETLEAIQLGVLYNTVASGGKLQTEAWIDLLEATEKGGDHLVALERLQSGGVIDVSTAYFRDLEAETGEFGGESFDGIAHNLVPDHLALLLDEPGACSVADGCGAPRLNSKGEPMDENENTTPAVNDAEGGDQENNWLRKTLVVLASGMDTLLKHAGGKMTKQEMIEKLIGAGKLRLTAEQLEPLADAALEILVGQIDDGPDDDDKRPDDEEPMPNEDDTPASEPAANAQDPPEWLARAEALFGAEGAIDKIDALIANSQKECTEKHDKLVSVLVANASCRFTKEQLDAMPVENLESLRQSLVIPNYSGNGETVPSGQGEIVTPSKMF